MKTPRRTKSSAGILAFSFAWAFLASSGAALAATKIIVTWDTVSVESPPEARTHHQPHRITYWLLGGNSLRTQLDQHREATLHLGQEGFDGYSKWTFRVLEGTFFIINEYSSFIIVKKLRTNGKDTCHEDIEFRKKPDNLYFDVVKNSLNSATYIADMHAELVTCAISNVPDSDSDEAGHAPQ